MTDFVLSSDQLRAVFAGAKNIAVVAGAGSGKTEIVARRIERLLRESEEDDEEDDFRILAVTYTVKASDELRERLASRLGELHRRVDTDTIHGFALSLLRQHGTRIGLPQEPEILTRDADRVELLDSWLRESARSLLNEPLAVFSKLDLARAKCEDAPFMSDWREAMASNGALDYAAMLDRASELADIPWIRHYLKRLYQHVFVDEAQNLTPAQYELLTRMIGDPSSDHINAVLVGDERQSIIDFAGADRTLISKFTKQYHAERIELHTNYRSARRIIEVGCAVAEELDQPTALPRGTDFPAKGSVEFRTCSDEQEEGNLIANWISDLLANGLDDDAVAPGETTTVQPEHIAVLARAAASLRNIRHILEAREIPNASASTEEEWVRSSAAKAFIEIVAYRSAPDHVTTRRRLAKLCGSDKISWNTIGDALRASRDSNIAMLTSLESCERPSDMVSAVLNLSINDPDWSDDLDQLSDAWSTFIDRTNISEQTFGNFRQHMGRCQRGDSMSPGVRLLTVHKAQGREFKAVAIAACNEGQFPDFRATSNETLAGELRAFYVAVSRPSRSLLLSRSRERNTRYGPRKTDPSSFLFIARKALSN
jgi:DNA helicase-2/ATP-dependent DNA helicase PcrA